MTEDADGVIHGMIMTEMGQPYQTDHAPVEYAIYMAGMEQDTVSTMISPEGIRQLFHRMGSRLHLTEYNEYGEKTRVEGTAQAGYIYMTAQAEESASTTQEGSRQSTSMMRQAMSQGL